MSAVNEDNQPEHTRSLDETTINAALNQLEEIKLILTEAKLRNIKDGSAENNKSDLARAQKPSDIALNKEEKSPVIGVLTYLIIAMCIIILGFVSAKVWTAPDPAVAEGYRILGEMKTYIEDIDAKHAVDDAQSSDIAVIQKRLKKLEDTKPDYNIPQKIDVTIKAPPIGLPGVQTEASKKAIGIINVDASSH